MRFKADGPTIPNILLEERDAGKVVFLCGAGVSIPAGLPSFVQLTRHVIEEVDPAQDSEIRRMFGPWSEEYSTVPGGVRPGLDHLFQLLNREYGRERVARIVWERLAKVDSTRTREHDIVARISANAEGDPQIVTTNFDRLFESALAERVTPIHKPPMYPDLRYGVPATGITYLHGRLADTESGPHDYILSSADLGRAYLAHGWATAFIQQLLQHHTVVLLGYRAEDPPVQYLLQGLDSIGRQTAKRLFAFDEGTRVEVDARWRDRGIEAIPYGDSHEALWETLDAWADRADNPTKWRSDVAELSAKGPRELAPHERGMVAHLVTTSIGAKQFADTEPAPPAEWLCVFDASCRYAEPWTGFGEEPKEFDPLDAYGLDDDAPRPREDEKRKGSPRDDLISWRRGDDNIGRWQCLTGVSWPASEPMPARLLHLARWLASRVHDPALAWWGARQPGLHPRLHAMLKRAVEESDALENHARNGWMTLLEALESGPRQSIDLKWLNIQREISKRGWPSGVIRAFEASTEPVFAVTEQYSAARARPPCEDWSTVEWKDVAAFGVHFPAVRTDRLNVPDATLEAVYGAVERNLMRASERLWEIVTTRFHLRTFYPEEGSEPHHPSKPDQYVDWFRELLNRLTVLTPTRLIRHIALWPDPDPLIFDRLRLYVWNKQELFSGNEAAGKVLALSDDQFWQPEHRRELMFLLRDRWTDFPAERRALIGRRILSGPPGPHDEDEAKHALRNAMTAAERFGWLVKEGCTLSESLRTKWTALKNGLPEWQDAWTDGAVATNELLLRRGWVETNEDVTNLEGMPIEKIVQEAQERSGPFVDDRPFTGLAKNHPRRAILALGFAARRGKFPDVLWRSVLYDWPEHAPRRATKVLLSRLRRLPRATIRALENPVGSWLQNGFPKSAGDDKALAYNAFDHLVGCLLAGASAGTESALGEQTIGGEPTQASQQTLMQAINGPIGKAVEGLLKEFGNENPGHGGALPADLKARLDGFIEAPGEGSGHAVCVLSRRIAWLHHLDSPWVAENMIPWFQLEDHRHEAAWRGILWNPWQQIQPVFGAIKASFLTLPSEMQRWASREETGQYCGWIVAASLLTGDDGVGLSFKEARQCLRGINPDGRQHVIWCLAKVGAGNDNGWQKLVIPFIRKAWPNEQRYQTGETTEAWLSLLEDTEDWFPKVLAAVRDHLGPASPEGSVLYAFHGKAGANELLTTKFPRDTLDLLDRVAPSGSQYVPYGLTDVLALLVEAEPALIGDKRYTRLDALAAQR